MLAPFVGRIHQTMGIPRDRANSGDSTHGKSINPIPPRGGNKPMLVVGSFRLQLGEDNYQQAPSLRAPTLGL